MFCILGDLTLILFTRSPSFVNIAIYFALKIFTYNDGEMHLCSSAPAPLTLFCEVSKLPHSCRILNNFYFTTINSLGLKNSIFTQNFNKLIGFTTKQLAFRHLINNFVVCVTNFVAAKQTTPNILSRYVRTFCVGCRIDRLHKWRPRKISYCLCAN